MLSLKKAMIMLIAISAFFISPTLALATASWTTTDDMVVTRDKHAAVKLPSGKVLAAGNIGLSRTPEVYDAPSTDMWSSKALMAKARYGHTMHMVTINGGAQRAMVIGGYGGTGPTTYLTSAELYNESGDSWTNAANMSTARMFHASVILGDGTVLVIGGTNASDTATVELYDPVNDTWTSKTSMSTARRLHTATVYTDPTYGERVLVTGGSTGVNGLNTTVIYDVSDNSWSAGPNMAYVRYGHRATTLPSGKILITGNGYSELFDPSSPGSFSTAVAMTKSRSYHTATLITLSDSSQRVLVTGMSGGSAADKKTTELYDITNDSWSASVSMAFSRYDHTATLLDDGTVLVAGGNGPIRDAEYYIAP